MFIPNRKYPNAHLIPSVYNRDTYIRDVARFWGANGLDPWDPQTSLDAAELLFEKGNYMGCASLLKNCHTASNMRGLNDRQVAFLVLDKRLVVSLPV